MKLIKKIATGIFSFLFSGLLFCQSVNFWTDMPNEQLARTIVNQMTDSELLAQTFMFGWAGSEPPELLHQWVKRGLGSVKVFGWNTDDIHLVAKSVNSLQHKAAENRFQIPLLVATDQEGGWIRHVKGNTSITPGNMAIGAGGYPVDSWYSAYYICREIRSLGINMNFAPTVDLYTNHESTIIGTRSFGDDGYKTGILGSAFCSGSLAAGVIPTVKHFPGHGDTELDSHGRLPEINIDFDTFKTRELAPYYYLIKDKVPAVMSGHLSFPQIVEGGVPASLSKYFLTDLLRNQMGYEGLLITDDITMVGATIYAGTNSNAFKLALEAGNDVVLSSTTLKLNEAAWTKNLDLMSENAEFRARVKDAAYRVVKTKLEYFKDNKNAAPLYPDPETIDSFVPDKEGEKFFLEQACRSVTVTKKGELLPLKNDENKKILLAGSLTSFFDYGKLRFPDAGKFHFSYDSYPENIPWISDSFASTARKYDIIIICVAKDDHKRILNSIKKMNKKVIVLSNMSPEIVEDLDWVDSILVGYSWRCDFSLEAMLSAVAGDYEPQGVLPYQE